MDSLNRLALFVQVTESQSFVAAGRVLGISASAVGKGIARLEEHLGVRLFHRNTRSINLTVEGSLFLERCRRILGELEAAEHELSQNTQEPSGRLRVSLPLVLGLFPVVLPTFMRRYPGIELDLDFSDRLVDVVEEGFDVVVRSGTPEDSRLHGRLIGTFQLKLVGSPAYFAERGIPRRPADLEQHACLHYKFPSTGKIQKWPLNLLPGESEPQLPSTLVCNQADTLIRIASAGLGIACLPDFAIRDALANGELHTVLDERNRHTGQFQALWPCYKQMPTRLRVFVDFLAEHLFPNQAP